MKTREETKAFLKSMVDNLHLSASAAAQTPGLVASGILMASAIQVTQAVLVDAAVALSTDKFDTAITQLQAEVLALVREVERVRAQAESAKKPCDCANCKKNRENIQ